MTDHFFPLGFFPTPVHPLKRIGLSFPDYRLFIKRDDQSGLALGGNKTRKLEYLMQDALTRQSGAVITSGAAQSNHCRQTTAACALAGIPCHLVLYDKGQSRMNGNLLIDHLLGAVIHWHDDGHIPESVAGRLTKAGVKPYIIPIGGSNETGCLGYVRAMGELQEQQEQLGFSFDHIVTATSSGGTQAGMILGKQHFGAGAEIIGINIDKTPIFGKPVEEHIHQIACRSAAVFKLRAQVSQDDICVIRDYDHSGYGVLTAAEKNAITRMARDEGILLDPVYTGRAFAALLDLLEKRYFKPGSAVLFWHTGGSPALFGYADQFTADDYKKETNY